MNWILQFHYRIALQKYGGCYDLPSNQLNWLKVLVDYNNKVFGIKNLKLMYCISYDVGIDNLMADIMNIANTNSIPKENWGSKK